MPQKTQRAMHRFQSVRKTLRKANSPVLSVENAADFDQLSRTIDEDVAPVGIIEQIYSDEISSLTWQMSRLSRSKRKALNRTYIDKLESIFQKHCSEYEQTKPVAGFHLFIPEQVNVDKEKFQRLQNIAKVLFTDEQAAKLKIVKLMDGHEIDYEEIEREVILESVEEFEAIDRLIISMEIRREKALRFISDFRYRFAAERNKPTGAVIDGTSSAVPLLENNALKKTSA